MRKQRVFKKRYVLVPILLFLAWLGWIVFFMTFPVEHELYKKVKINNAVNLYVTQASAGAMTSFSYHYYLYDAKKSDTDFMDHVKSETAFMVTNDDRAIAEVKEGQLYLRVHGKIYSFNNVSNGVRINLDASPYQAPDCTFLSISSSAAWFSSPHWYICSIGSAKVLPSAVSR